MSGPEDTDAAARPPKPRWRYWAELFVVCLVSVLAAQLFARFASPAAVEAARSYQTRALNELEAATPLQTYRLFRQSMGDAEADPKAPSGQMVLARGLCGMVGDLQIAILLRDRPAEGRLVVVPGGRLRCEPPVVGDAPSALDLLRQNGLILPDARGLSAAFGLTPAACIFVLNEAADARNACLASIPPDVAGWGARVAAYSEGFRFAPVRAFLWLLQPLAALADVVWHNYLDWAPGALLRLMLVGIGLLLTVRLALRIFPADDPLSFIFVAAVVVPLGTVAISTGLIWLCLKIAGYLLYFLGGTLDLASSALLAGSAFSLSVLGKTVLMMGERHLGAVRKQVSRT
jgi:hypothetical protein